jgi:5'-3' exonuclease
MRLHLVDGTFELYRAHYSHRPPHVSPDGRDLKATLGVLQSLLALLADPTEEVTHVAVAFDNPISSFRNALFSGYKSDAGVPPEIRAQFDDVETAVAALGVAVWSMREFEADDALATAAAQFSKDPHVDQVRILSLDKDLAQVLAGDRVVQVDRIRKKVMTEATLWSDKKLRPASVPDFLALVGDDADGIPGLTGWGAKSTAEVLSVYPHLQDIPDQADLWSVRPRGFEKLALSLRAARADASLYRTLATLRLDVPLHATLDQLEWKGAPRQSWELWCKRVGTTSLLHRPQRWF